MSKILITEYQLENIRSLREYLITTSKFTELFREVTGQDIPNDVRFVLANPKFFYHGLPLLFIWLGLLNSVIEGWFKLRLKNKLLDDLIGTSGNKSENTRKLEDFRNSIFHFQTERKPLHMDFIYEPDLLLWAKKVNLELEKWFDYYFTSSTLPRDEPHYEYFRN